MKLTGKRFDTAADIPIGGVVCDLWELGNDSTVLHKVKEDEELVYFKRVSGGRYGENDGFVEFPKDDRGWYEVDLERSLEHGEDAMKALYWNDPDPIEGNDYRVTYLELIGGVTYRIQYGGGSEAEVYIHELEIR